MQTEQFGGVMDEMVEVSPDEYPEIPFDVEHPFGGVLDELVETDIAHPYPLPAEDAPFDGYMDEMKENSAGESNGRVAQSPDSGAGG